MDHLNVLQAAGGHLAAIGLTKAGKGPLGQLISPAVWFYNWCATGATPNSVDGAIYAISFGTGLLGPVSIAIGYVKAAIDDDLEHKVESIRATEPHQYRAGINAIVGWGPPSALAGEFAMAGGTAWQGSNGAWVTLVDGHKRLVPNYRPRHAIAIRRPIWPLSKASDGRSYVIEDKLSSRS